MAGRGAGVLLLLLLVLLVLLVRRLQLLMQLALQLLLLLLLRGCQVGAAVDRGNIDVGLAAHTPARHKQDSPHSQFYRHVRCTHLPQTQPLLCRTNQGCVPPHPLPPLECSASHVATQAGNKSSPSPQKQTTRYLLESPGAACCCVAAGQVFLHDQVPQAHARVLRH